MKIGVDATCWGNKRGFGRFTRELLEALLEIDSVNEYLFFIDSHTDDADLIPTQVQKIVANTDVSATEAASANGRRSVKDLWAMTRQVLEHKIDVFFFPAVYSYFPIFNRTKIVVTLHDMIADHHPKLIFPNTKSKIFWKIKQNAAVRQADVIATVSEYSKQQIIEYFDLPESRLRIISEAARPEFKVVDSDNAMHEVLVRYQLKKDEKFLLYVGGISPHKNLGVLIDTFKLIVDKPDVNIKLVLVGDYQDDPFFSAYPALRKKVEELEIVEKVIFTGFVPDRELVYFYNAAALLVLPSLEEGFGLPAIEGMSCGTPVAASNRGSLPEVLAEAGRFFDPRDPRDMATVIEAILSDESLRNTMRDNGLNRSTQFRWKKAAEDTLAIFNEFAETFV
ncbi:MAG: glycosyltransferase family 4 protein [Pyrinomonadaceae bacterium]